MALSSQEQNKIVTLLGYGVKIIQPGSVIYNKILNDRLNNVTPAGEDLVRSYLLQIAAIETQMNCAPSRLSAKKVGDLEMNLNELEMLRRERKKIAREISVQVDIPYMGTGGSNIGICS